MEGEVWAFSPNHAIAYTRSNSFPDGVPHASAHTIAYTRSNSFPNGVPHASAHTKSNASSHPPKTMQEKLRQENKKLEKIVQKGPQMRCLP